MNLCSMSANLQMGNGVNPKMPKNSCAKVNRTALYICARLSAASEGRRRRSLMDMARREADMAVRVSRFMSIPTFPVCLIRIITRFLAMSIPRYIAKALKVRGGEGEGTSSVFPRCRASNLRFEPSAVSPLAKPTSPKGLSPRNNASVFREIHLPQRGRLERTARQGRGGRLEIAPTTLVGLAGDWKSPLRQAARCIGGVMVV